MRPTLVSSTVDGLEEREYKDVTYIVYRAGDRWFAETEITGVGAADSKEDVIALAEFSIDDEGDE